MSAGKLTSRAKFYSPSSSVDEAGQTEVGFAFAFEVWVKTRYLRGGEDVLASRLSARAPVIITVRASANTKTVRSNWKLEIDGMEFNIREHPQLTDNRHYLQFLAESGVPI